MKRRNYTDKFSPEKGDSQTRVSKCYFPPTAVKPKVVKKNLQPKAVENKIAPVTLIESINNIEADLPRNTPCGRSVTKKQKLAKLSKISRKDKNLSAFLKIIAASSLETRDLTCGFNRFGNKFYDVSCEELARNLLGQVLVRRFDNGVLLKGRIIETECYLGGDDKASHSHNGKITERNLPMYMKPGTAYVYFTYGMYHCFNISSRGPGAAVLLRALEPLEGSDLMLANRIAGTNKTTKQAATSSRDPKAKKPLMVHQLCNGPAKLCTSFSIEKLSCNKRILSEWEGMWVEKFEDGLEVREHQIVKTCRVGIDSAGIEWAMKPLRFYLMESKAVSRRDKNKEKELKMVAKLLGTP